ncbi:MAG: trans-aconitate 2-methyltransferase [Candidatus Dormibacteria bacterium]
MVDDVEAERAYWDAAGTGDGRGEIFSIPGIHGWEAGIQACLAELLPALAGPLAREGKILDLGCGIGRLTMALAEGWPETAFYGVDVSDVMVRLARREAKSKRLGNARFMVGDGRTLPRSLPRLSSVFSVLTFQHLPYEAQRGYIRAVAAKLDPGGVFRLQFVTTEVDHFLSHGVVPDAMSAWCREAGLEPTEWSWGAVDESWGWITAVKL